MGSVNGRASSLTWAVTPSTTGGMAGARRVATCSRAMSFGPMSWSQAQREWCCQHWERGCEYVTDIPDFTCRTTASLEEACRKAALARGLKLGGSGHAFAGN